MTTFLHSTARNMLDFFGMSPINRLANPSLSKEPARKGSKGKVYLVGAGPGDAELLTIKAYKALQHADIVLFDCLVDSSVLALIPSRCEKEFVGKRSGKHSLAQGDISERIVYHAKLGKQVVRLKGGDPAIFARTVEETETLAEHNIPFVIVPGISSASGASAYTGIPLTHRACAQSVLFATASFQTKNKEPDWCSLASASQHQTLVFYMGFKKLGIIGERLIAHGVSPDYPIAVIDQACTANQKLCEGTLSDIRQKVQKANFIGPALIICGDVVKHRQNIDVASLYDNAYMAEA